MGAWSCSGRPRRHHQNTQPGEEEGLGGPGRQWRQRHALEPRRWGEAQAPRAAPRGTRWPPAPRPPAAQAFCQTWGWGEPLAVSAERDLG